MLFRSLLVRWHRMLGDNTLWMPGTDHAGIATQAVVEKRLKELEGLTRHDVGREGLVERIWRWKDQYQARISEQQQRMGCSCDWQRQRFTMDAVCARAGRPTFLLGEVNMEGGFLHPVRMRLDAHQAGEPGGHGHERRGPLEPGCADPGHRHGELPGTVGGHGDIEDLELKVAEV